MTRHPESRAGFALLTTLVTLVILSAVGAKMLYEIGTITQAAQNRLATTRAGWAALGCLALLQGNYLAPEHPLDQAPIDLGADAACSATEADPGARLNVNRADSASLAQFLDSRTASAILDWRDSDDADRRGGSEVELYRLDNAAPPRNEPFRHADELLLLRGVNRQRLLEKLEQLTVHGDGRLNPNLAPVEVLTSLSFLSPSNVEAILARRASEPFSSVAQLQEILGSTEDINATEHFVLDRLRRTVTLVGWGSAGARTLEIRRTATLFAVESRLGIGRIEIR